MTWLFRNATPRRVDSLFRKGPTLLRRPLQPRTRHQRRPEDDGHHRHAALLERLERAELHERFPFWIVLVCHTAMGLGT